MFCFGILYIFNLQTGMFVEVKLQALERHKQAPHKLLSRFHPSPKYPCWSYVKAASFIQLPAVDVTFQRCYS